MSGSLKKDVPSVDVSKMSGAARVAYILMSMDSQVAAAVTRHMGESTIALVTDAMATLPPLSHEDAYQVYAQLMSDFDSPGGIMPGGFSAFKSILINAFGNKRADEMLERIMRSNSRSIDVLANVDPKILADQIKDERPQLIAVLMGQMPKATAVACLNAFNDDLAVDVMFRFARLEAIQGSALDEMRLMMSDMLGGHVGSKSDTAGGVRQAADLLNAMSGSMSDRTLSRIRDIDPGLADRIRENMFTFDDLMRLPDQALQQVIRTVDQNRLVPALRGASQSIRERFFANISSKEVTILRDEIDNGPMITRADAQAAQRSFIDAALNLAQEGKISITGDEDML
jgi:flagellar motor switch protein FliG